MSQTALTTVDLRGSPFPNLMRNCTGSIGVCRTLIGNTISMLPGTGHKAPLPHAILKPTQHKDSSTHIGHSHSNYSASHFTPCRTCGLSTCSGVNSCASSPGPQDPCLETGFQESPGMLPVRISLAQKRTMYMCSLMPCRAGANKATTGHLKLYTCQEASKPGNKSSAHNCRSSAHNCSAQNAPKPMWWT